MLTDRVVLVSGGTQGVGAAIARAAARAGAAVVISGRRAGVGEAAAADLRAETGSDVTFVAADVSSVDAAVASVSTVLERRGRIDGLVNAAGLTSRGSILETSPELFDEHIAVNLRAPFFMMQAAARDMRRRGAPGSIVNIITMSAHGGQPYLAPYVAAKAGLAGVTRNAAHALRWDRIRVNGVNIGWTSTPGEDQIQRTAHGAGDGWATRAAAGLPMGRLALPADVAGLAVLLLSDDSGVVTGSVIDWDQAVLGGHD